MRPDVETICERCDQRQPLNSTDIVQKEIEMVWCESDEYPNERRGWYKVERDELGVKLIEIVPFVGNKVDGEYTFIEISTIEEGLWKAYETCPDGKYSWDWTKEDWLEWYENNLTEYEKMLWKYKTGRITEEEWGTYRLNIRNGEVS